jgi:adenylate cyclase, class 2
MRHQVPHEIEIKLKVEDSRVLKKRLKECGFVMIERRHFESNIVFDFHDFRLRRSRSLLRLRTEGSCNLLTFKGPPQASDSYKIRTEIETRLEGAAALQQILEVLGLRPVFRYEKYRTAYAESRRRKVETSPLLVFDETPMGRYIELEGPMRWIDRAARRLGYQKRDYITASYAALYLNHCRENAIKPGDMVFQSDKS